MKRLFLTAAAVLVPALASHADQVIVLNGKLHTAPSKLAPLAGKVDKDRLASATFVRLERNEGGEHSLFVLKGPEALPAFTLAKKPSKPSVPKLEGCGRHPMEWLPKSKVVGQLQEKAPEGTLFVEVPAGFTPVKEAPSKELVSALKKQLFEGYEDPEANEPPGDCLRNVRVFEKAGEKVAYTSCSDELNESLYVFHQKAGAAWKPVERKTLTEECP
ncbi:hypothetical protein HPC49_20945 [Pyxidicoccus fallax]|uniref:Lipoprotein n=1 Tax=Pyxidicoccus fallax TaxID=394095 RepID=A0A848LR88_9BACT|nr:hypothetical protein [Pyxidicoccus fallax]NMO20073.1 hypothetical protein [Pyxidicoccus fallax]NPC80681.1 hypothetical protein [Pyxidicoccus fallax]